MHIACERIRTSQILFFCGEKRQLEIRLSSQAIIQVEGGIFQFALTSSTIRVTEIDKKKPRYTDRISFETNKYDSGHIGHEIPLVDYT